MIWSFSSCCGGISPVAGLTVCEGLTEWCKSVHRGESVLHYRGTAVLHYVLRFKAMRRNLHKHRPSASPATVLWITYSDKWPRAQGHLHFTTSLWGRCTYTCLCVYVRLSFFSLINGLYYLELLNFISSGSLQRTEHALLLPLVCKCVRIPTQSTTFHSPTISAGPLLTCKTTNSMGMHLSTPCSCRRCQSAELIYFKTRQESTRAYKHCR